jgi:imidazolonepropionase-like amidohydrolase
MKAKALVGALLIFASLPVFAEKYAIHAGHLIDPSTGAVLQDRTIIVVDGRIQSIGAGEPGPKDAVPIDLSQEWVLPGLMDAHTHLSLTEIGSDALPLESTYLRDSTAYRALRGEYNARALVRAGFTTIRDVGNSGDYAMQDVRRAVEAGWFVGPTVVDAGKIIAAYGGQSHEIPPEQGALWRYDYIDADSVSEIRKAVRMNIYHGAGVIKLVLDNSPYHYSLDEVRAAVDEAHRAGVGVAVHVYGGEPADNAIEAGVDSIEHGFELTDPQLKKMKEKGIFLVGTDYPRAHLDIIGTAGGVFPEPAVLAPQIIDRLKRAHRIGVRLAFGSDTVMEVAGRSRADLMFDYLAVWRAAQISPAEILKSMTSEPAQLLRVDKVRGRVAVGQAADLIATPADPLSDIENLRHVNFVMKDGRVADLTPANPRR